MKKPIDPIEKYILEKFREMGIQAIPLKEKKNLESRAHWRISKRKK
jgi:hypothetical protein